ncbi:hypothetical protein ACFFUE_06520 [Bergeyella porcorum]|uniref:hypothetical protein n=1 Tax=Bergeyella porcorum TaxID=1735111 RepID=UPI0035F0F72C
MKNLTKFAIKLLKIVFWLSQIGVVVNLVMITWIVLSHNLDWEAPRKFYESMDVSAIYKSTPFGLNGMMLCELLKTLGKLSLFWIAIKILNQLDANNFFNFGVSKLIYSMSFLAFLIGATQWFEAFFIEKNIPNELLLYTQLDNDSFITTSLILFLMGVLYQKALELKQENELTI